MDRINVQEKVDGASFNRFHLVVFLWTSLVVVLDGYDLAVPGVALPAIMANMKVSAAAAGFMASSALFGMAFGAIVLGAVADRIGRRKVFAISIFLFSAFTLAAGFSTEPLLFSAMRFFAGVGIGGALPNAVAHMSEYAPRRSRGRLVGLMMCGYTIGSVLAALIGKACIEAYGWRSVFIVAGVPLLIIPFVMTWMPESLAYLVRTNKQDELREVLRRILPDQRFAPDAVFVGQTAARGARTPLGQLFADGRAQSTVLIWVAFFMGLFMLYAMSTWLVTLLTRSGHTLGAALTFLLVYNAGVIIGTIVGAWVGDRFSLKWVLAFFYAMGAASLAALGYAPNQPALFVLIAIVGASVVGTQNLCYAYTGQFYPLASRSVGLGAAAGVGRVGAIVAPLLIGALVSLNLPPTTCFMAIAVASAIGALAITGVNHRRCASANPGNGNLQFDTPD
ncbi:MFS transporter [Caballeronia insecticola]|uniref:Major facilitator superfamily MFS_1 n=1 Tax=Caballeronia insecticola TaxID=758793 RepID=R4X1X7_9BURK|nr:MFS transporter [Caballeronia insecticola]BAN26396.1 major facilitator superfamily MFS_1 [Caballeronia insecticola]